MDAPSAPKPLTVLCVPTRCRMPVAAVPDRLETSSAAASARRVRRAGGGNVPTGAGLRPGAKAPDNAVRGRNGAMGLPLGEALTTSIAALAAQEPCR